MPTPSRNDIYEAVIRKMACPAMTEIHDGFFGGLIKTGGIGTRFRILLCGRVMSEDHTPALVVISIGDQLKEVGVGVIDDKRWCSGKIGVSPGVSQHMHRNANRLQGLFANSISFVDLIVKQDKEIKQGKSKIEIIKK